MSKDDGGNIELRWLPAHWQDRYDPVDAVSLSYS